MRKRILFLDDQPYFAKIYLEALKERYEVVYCDRVDLALSYIRSDPGFDGMVLDIMMPPHPSVSEASFDNGLLTGIWVLEQVRDIVIRRPMPVLVLTHRDLGRVKEEVAAIELPAQRVDVRSKEEVRADRVCDVLDALLGLP